jgi:hypothetical protein
MSETIHKSADNRLRLTIPEFKSMLPLYFNSRKAILIEGESGIGKTEISRQFVESVCKRDKTWGYVLWQPTVHDPSDFSGMMGVVNGVTIFIPTELTVFNKRKMILIIDELTQCSRDMQRALLGLFNATPVVGKHKLDLDDLWIIGTANDNSLDDYAYVDDISSGMFTRVGRIVLLPSLPDTITYLNEKYFDNMFVKFLRSDACSITHDFSTEKSSDKFVRALPRTLEFCAKAIHSNRDADSDQLVNLVAAYAGKNIGLDFQRNINAEKILDYKAFFTLNAPEISVYFGDVSPATTQLLSGAVIKSLQNYTVLTNRDLSALVVNLDKLGDNGFGEVKAVGYHQIVTIARESAANSVFKKFVYGDDKSNREGAETFLGKYTEYLAKDNEEFQKALGEVTVKDKKDVRDSKH